MRLLAGKLLGLCTTLLVGGLIAAFLIRLAPGFDVDERELDTRRSEESLRHLRESHANRQSAAAFYFGYLGNLLSGDLGVSRISQQPVRDLIGDRAPRTLRTAAAGYGIAWAGGLALAALAVGSRSPVLQFAIPAIGGLLLSVPAACAGFVALWFGLGPHCALAAVLFPRVLRYASGVLAGAWDRPHVLMARAKGVSGARIVLVHLLRPAAGELLALAGATTGLAFGLAIPIEVICDSPGLGQLAWQAASGRDVPVLVALTLVVTLLVKTSAISADLLRSGLRENHG